MTHREAQCWTDLKLGVYIIYNDLLIYIKLLSNFLRDNSLTWEITNFRSQNKGNDEEFAAEMLKTQI